MLLKALKQWSRRGTGSSGEDVIFGKTTPIAQDNPQCSAACCTRRDCITSVGRSETGIVDQVLIKTNAEGYRFGKVKVRSVQIPQIGDEFSSQRGQKGIVGIAYTQGDTPWTVEGITPDVIVNPHVIPSRMTVGQFIECIMGRVSASTGKEGDATPLVSASLGKEGDATPFTKCYTKFFQHLSRIFGSFHAEIETIVGE
ncbi:DNA-directed RNA polymerase II subunit RPB2-like isoform X1 [Diospyros lotus]|uniref:DNA-directed RNA polymerase II subunit RPB2-like isoform X1 n=1 Tax=Diospyros lotus TaxID=55363 RepID=UPI00225AF2EB|nr:DNA-directed RNA polymerase II subunit RPB2-like isoform X1 [Diospyros lotus]XP_052201987.1 DNA-directed RNA polymerase II subunit RPB2-like isoform X1 [Diospyros lotus]